MSKEVSLFLFETESHSVAEASLELTMMLLIQPFHCWGYWFKLLNLVKRILHNSDTGTQRPGLSESSQC